MNIRRATIVINPDKPGAARLAARLKKVLRRQGVRIESDRRNLSRRVAASDLVVVIGGDGTLLHVARYVGADRPLVFGVNLGALGFLTEITAQEAPSVLSACLQGKLAIRERMMLDAAVTSRPHQVFRVLNDVVIMRESLSRVITLRVDIGQVGGIETVGDGLIIASPTGSTAHSLSAGGPIVHPLLDAFVLTTICPHTLSNRPLVIPADDEHPVIVTFQGSRGGASVTFDGQLGLHLRRRDRVVIRRSVIRFQLVSPPRRTYFEVLQKKLHLSYGRVKGR